MNIRDPENALQKMDEAIRRFHVAAQQTGNPAFGEFAGVMALYLKLCRRAHEAGGAFAQPAHANADQLQMTGVEAAYFREKLTRLFGASIGASVFEAIGKA